MRIGIAVADRRAVVADRDIRCPVPHGVDADLIFSPGHLVEGSSKGEPARIYRGP